VLAFGPGEEGEREAFAAQVAALGTGTTLLVDTYDIAHGIRLAAEVAGPALAAVRIDSGDVGAEAVRARALLDRLGATGTKLIVTGDLDAHTIAALGAAPIDGYGVGTSVVTGMGVPSAGFVYKLVAVTAGGAAAGQPMVPVAKRSLGKASVGGRKWAWRAHLEGDPCRYEAGAEVIGEACWADIVTVRPQGPPEPGARPLQVQVMAAGRPAAQPSLAQSRAFHALVRNEVAEGPLVLERRPG